MVDNLVKCYYKKDKNPVEQEERPEDSDLKSQEEEINKTTKKRICKKQKEIVKKVAVKGVSFGVNSGDTFALLGVNGAGKSSTFNCMMGKETISGGHIFLNKLNMRNLLGKPYMLHKSLGYCP